jgi:hypothetical protein
MATVTRVAITAAIVGDECLIDIRRILRYQARGVRDRDQRGDEIVRANLNDQILHPTGQVANLYVPDSPGEGLVIRPKCR